MSISSTPITNEMTDKLAKSLERVLKGTRDPEAMRRTIDAMNRSREETRQKVGSLDVAIDLIRDARDQ